MSEEQPRSPSGPKGKGRRAPKATDRSFRRLEERSRTSASLPVAALTGLVLGALGGLAAGAWDLAVLSRAGLELLPDRTPEGLRPWALLHLLVGGGLGLLAGATGAWGTRWTVAASIGWAAWMAGGPVAASVGGGPAGLAAVVAAVLAGALGGFLAARAPLPAWFHGGLAAHVGVGLALLSPFWAHLTSSPGSAGSLAFAALVALLILPLVPLAALTAREGRAPVVGVLILLSTGAGAAMIADQAPPASWRPTRPGPLVVVVAVDGLRADLLQASTPGSAPTLERWARAGVRFGQARTTSNWSVPALGSLFTGLWPYRHGAGLHDGGRQLHTPLRADVPTLAARLSEGGWGTAAVVADRSLRRYGLDAGFQVWSDDPPGGAAPSLASPLIAAGLSLDPWARPTPAAAITDRALAQAALDPDRARLLFVQYADLAGPFLSIPEDRAAAAAAPLPGRPVEVDASLRTLEREVGRLLDGLPRGAWVVLLGTRGMALDERREEGAAGERHGSSLHDEILRIPLVIRGPGTLAREDLGPASLVDVAPTLLRAAQGEPAQGEERVSLGEVDGAVLEPLFGGRSDPARAVLAQSSLRGSERQAVVQGAHKLVRRGEERAIFDLVADPNEARALASDGTVDALERRLDALLPPDGSGATLRAPPPLALQLGRISSRLWGAR